MLYDVYDIYVAWCTAAADYMSLSSKQSTVKNANQSIGLQCSINIERSYGNEWIRESKSDESPSIVRYAWSISSPNDLQN